jgi:hypothetical protein
MCASDKALEESEESRCCYVCFEPCEDANRCACVQMGLHQRCLVQMLEHGHETVCRVCGTAFRGVRVDKVTHLDCRSSLNRLIVYTAFCSATASLTSASVIVVAKRNDVPLSVFVVSAMSLVSLSMWASLAVLMSIYLPCPSRVETRVTVDPVSVSVSP